MATPMPSDKGRCYPVEIINGCVWLYFGFPLSFRKSRNSCSKRCRGQR
jgi:putative transposase